jgi:hypothetical protein
VGKLPLAHQLREPRVYGGVVGQKLGVDTRQGVVDGDIHARAHIGVHELEHRHARVRQDQDLGPLQVLLKQLAHVLNHAGLELLQGRGSAGGQRQEV